MRRILLALLLAPIAALAHEPDLTRLPLGDGKTSTEPKAGFIWACRIDPNAGGAFRNGPWIHDDGTYDFTKKAVVSGDVTWPHQFAITLKGDRRVFITNDLPDHATGIFPIPPSDEAFQYDRNPNRIAAWNVMLDLPAHPVVAVSPSCAPGAVGVLISGAVLFNALDAPGRDAVARETQDKCQGHPQETGIYHYHSVSTCLGDKREADGSSSLVGYALDGFGIYGRYGEGGKLLASADLDDCHGRVSRIVWDGKPVEMYHYVATWDFPYTIGCLRGTFDREDVRRLAPPPMRRN
jgi:YHYH protein